MRLFGQILDRLPKSPVPSQSKEYVYLVALAYDVSKLPESTNSAVRGIFALVDGAVTSIIASFRSRSEAERFVAYLQQASPVTSTSKLEVREVPHFPDSWVLDKTDISK